MQKSANNNISAIRHDLIACPHCDALYQRPKIKKNSKLYCLDCKSALNNPNTNLQLSFVFALTAIILFIIAHTSPFITLNLQGEISTISIFSSVKALTDNGLFLLSIMVMLFIIILPLYYLLALLWTIISFRLRFLDHITRHFLHWLHHIAPWNMLEVYLIGVIVTLVKIMSMASVRFEIGFWAFVLLLASSIIADIHFKISDPLFMEHHEHAHRTT